jgi:superfamily II DNA or RNA helicase
MNPLRKNQEEALHYFKQHYYENKETRGILSMCCGSGKTRTFYEIMKYCFEQNEKLCIYTTSRILLVENAIQEILEYLYLEKQEDKIKNFCIMVKVSNFNIENITTNIYDKLKKEDKLRDKDETKEHFNNNFLKNQIQTLVVTLGVSSNTYEISDDYDQNNIVINSHIGKNKNILIITTYDSLVKMYIETIPDLIICDESHHLVSDNNKLTNKIIDKNLLKTINPNKYLFMTATPLTITKTNENSPITKIYSMENENIFGKCFYEYTFYDGIQDKCIVPFDILVCDKLILKNNNPTTDIEKQNIYLNVVIEQMLKSIIMFNLKRTIVYISNQEKAKKMKEMVENVIVNNNDYNNIGVKWIISEDPNSVKTKTIKWFTYTNDNKDSKILISVNIFDEGIDIPICDSVLFAEPRHSETQIVQNIGRALRMHINKTKAYVILPVYVPKNIDEKNTLEGFSDIRNICNKLLSPNITKMYERKYSGYVNERYETKKDSTPQTTTKNVNNDNNDNKAGENSLNIQDISITKLKFEIKINEPHQNYVFQDNNDDYYKYKTIVQLNKYRIRSLYDLHLFNIETKIIQEGTTPHELFRETFISYGDLLYNKTNSYETSVKYLNGETNDPILRDYINSRIRAYCNWRSCDWENYHKKILSNLFYNINIDDTARQLSQTPNFLNLPVYPKKYYSNVWRNWSNYLNVNLKEDEKTHNKKSNPSYTSRANENFNQLPKTSWTPIPITPESILELLNYIKKYYNLNNVELKGFINYNIRGECKYIYLYFENELIFTINNTGEISYTPHNFKNTSFKPTPTQFNKNRSLQIKGIDVINVFNNIHLD